MTTIAANCSASDRVIVVNPGSAPAHGFRFRIDDEILEYLGPDRSNTQRILAYLQGDRTRWRVSRGLEGTTAASHTSGDTLYAVSDAFATGENLTPPGPFAGGDASSLSSDIVAALEAADSPSAENPFVTGIKFVTKTLNAAALLAVAEAAYELIPATAGVLHWPLAALAVYHAGNQAFGDGSTMRIGPDDGAGGGVSWLEASSIGATDGTADSVVSFKSSDPSWGFSADAVGGALYFFGLFVTGDGNGSMDIIVMYRDVAIS